MVRLLPHNTHHGVIRGGGPGYGLHSHSSLRVFSYTDIMAALRTSIHHSSREITESKRGMFLFLARKPAGVFMRTKRRPATSPSPHSC